MTDRNKALILTRNLNPELDKWARYKVESELSPLIEIKAERLKLPGLSEIFVTFGKASEEFRDEIRSYGATPLEVKNYEKGHLNSFSALRERSNEDVVVTKATRIYPQEVLEILSSFKLECDFLVAVDTSGDLNRGRGVRLSNDLVRPSVLDIGKIVDDPDAIEMGIYLSAPSSLHEAAGLVSEGRYSIIDLIESVNTKVLPFNGVNCYEPNPF